MDADKLTYEIVGAAIEVHRELGPGLLESTYERCLVHELAIRGIKTERQKSEYLRPLLATPGRALASVDRGETATGHHGKPTLRASGLDESQESPTQQAAGNVPAAIQPILYKGLELDEGYRIDILVESQIILELKVVDTLSDIHTAQLLTYLKLSNLHLGYLLNFNVTQMTQGIKRQVHDFKP